MIYRDVDPELDNLAERRNYRKADNINYEDGDWQSSIYYQDDAVAEAEMGGRQMYVFGTQTLINDRARVYKGGSWMDRAFYVTPGARRYLQEELSTDFIGFRCAMTRVGSPQGNTKKGGNWFKSKKKPVKRKYK